MGWADLRELQLSDALVTPCGTGGCFPTPWPGLKLWDAVVGYKRLGRAHWQNAIHWHPQSYGQVNIVHLLFRAWSRWIFSRHLHLLASMSSLLISRAECIARLLALVGPVLPEVQVQLIDHRILMIGNGQHFQNKRGVLTPTCFFTQPYLKKKIRVQIKGSPLVQRRVQLPTNTGHKFLNGQTITVNFGRTADHAKLFPKLFHLGGHFTWYIIFYSSSCLKHYMC